MAGIKFSEFPIISSTQIKNIDRVLGLYKDGSVFKNYAFEIGELQQIFISGSADIYISGSGQDVQFGIVTASSLQIGGVNISTAISQLESFSSSLNATFATDAEVSAVSASFASNLSSTDSTIDSLSSSIETRISNQETFSSSLDSTFATDSELSSVSSSLVNYAVALSSSLTVTDNSLQSQITSVSNSLSTLDVTSASYASTASYIEYSNVENKPTLISGSSQISQQISGAFSFVSSSIAIEINSLQSFSSSLDSIYVSSSGQNVLFGAVSASSMNINGNVNVNGILTADELFISEVTRSIAYASGSTKWGDTPDDNHRFTGSAIFQTILALNLPTSSLGLQSGSIWNNGGALYIV